MDAIGLSILTGMKPWLTSIDDTVANRFNKIQHRIVEREGIIYMAPHAVSLKILRGG